MRRRLFLTTAATGVALVLASGAAAGPAAAPVATGLVLKGHWYKGSVTPETGSYAGAGLQFRVSPDGKQLLSFVFDASFTCSSTASSDFFSVPVVVLRTQVKPYHGGLKQTYNDFSFKGAYSDTARNAYHGAAGTISITGVFSNGGKSVKGKVLLNFTTTEDTGCSTGTVDWTALPGSGPLFR